MSFTGRRRPARSRRTMLLVEMPPSSRLASRREMIKGCVGGRSRRRGMAVLPCAFTYGFQPALLVSGFQRRGKQDGETCGRCQGYSHRDKAGSHILALGLLLLNPALDVA